MLVLMLVSVLKKATGTNAIKKIRKRDGKIVDFDQNKIAEAIWKAAKATGGRDRQLAVKSAAQVVERLTKQLKPREIPTVEQVQDLVELTLIENGHARIAKAYILYRQKRTEIRKAKTMLGIVDELKLPLNSILVLERRYLQKDENGKVVESTGQMFKRIAKGIAEVEKKYGKSDHEVKALENEFYRIMTNLEFIPNSPTLMNTGTYLRQLSACFVLPVGDSIESIFDTLKAAALIHKTGGGTGFAFSRLRPKGDIVKTTGGIASGPISFAMVYDTATDVVKQGGRRRGANMGVLRVDHPDIMDFIVAKEKEGVLRNFNISVGATDQFMRMVEKDADFELINPRNNEVAKKLKARAIWNLIIMMAWKNGEPGVIFLDTINKFSPTPQIGQIESTNPCVTSDTWVMTEEGPMRVRDLVNKPFVAIANGQRWNGSKEGFFPTGVKPVLKLKTKEGFELRLTKNHKVLRMRKLTRYATETEWTRAGDLKPEDKIVINNHRRLQGWSGNYTEGEGYLMGLLLGDGTVKDDKVVLSSWGEENGSETVRDLAYSYAKEMPHRADFQGWVKVKDRDEYRMATEHIKKMATNLGLKPGTKLPTEAIEKASSSFCRGFLKGLFDTDGSVQGKQAKGVSVRLAQSNLETLKTVQRLLLRFGISSTIYVNRRTEGYSWMPNGKGGTKRYPRRSQHELVISKENLRVFQEMIGFGDSDKRSKVEGALNSYQRKLNRERFVATVSELVPDGEEQVYDVQIPGINAFDANGFFVHNCGEQPLLPYESCNLGSIDVSRFVTEEGKMDWNRLRETVRVAVRFLDNVVDANAYVLPEIEAITKGNRKIGLGVMGFADMLIKRGIRYDTEEGLKAGEELMKFINDQAHRMSAELGKEKGDFPNFQNSTLKKGWKTHRNATVTTVAPTGTISIIAGCSQGIEPLFAIAYIREIAETLGRSLVEVNPLFENIALHEGFYNEELIKEISRRTSIQDLKDIPEKWRQLFVTAHDISAEMHVRMQAAFQRYTDNAVSKTINFPKWATPNDVEKAYMLAWKLGCKGITVYRHGSREMQVLRPIESEGTVADYSRSCPTCI